MNGTTAPAGGSAGGVPLGEAFLHAPDPMVVTDLSGTVVDVNRAFTELTGSSETGRRWYEMLEGGDAERGRRAHQDALTGEGGGLDRMRLAMGDKAARVIDVRLRLLPGGADAAQEEPVLGVVVLMHVLSRAETDLQVATELRVDGTDSVLWSLDLGTGRIEEMFPPSRLGELLAGPDHTLERFMERVHPDDLARVRDAMEASLQGRDYEQRFRMLDQLGDERSLHSRARFVPGDPDRLVGITEDVTEHVQLIRRLADRRRVEAEHGRRITELSAKLVSATTVDEVTNLLTEEFLPIFGGMSAVALLVEGQVLRPAPAARAAGGGTLPMIEGRSASDTDFPMGAVVQDRQPRFFESRAEVLSRFPAVADMVRRSKGQAWATVPIFGDRRVALGVWQMVWDKPHHATPDERALMLTFAGLAGQALQRIKAQQAELELADAMQRRMLPPQLPRFDDIEIGVRYLPSRAGWRICGDFYDVIELPGRRVGLLVGDVQGHGVEAAAAMGQIRVAFRAYAANQADPGLVLAATNRLLSETGEMVFATCGYLVLDRDTGKMQAAWAGQPPVILANGGGFEVWGPETGPPVGVEAQARYPVSGRDLPPGTSLLLCSDGLVESSRVPMEAGLEQVGRAFAQMEGTPATMATSLADLAPAGRGDDIAILVARMG